MPPHPHHENDGLTYAHACPPVYCKRATCVLLLQGSGRKLKDIPNGVCVLEGGREGV
jgi:hypothetical protein